MDTTPTKARLSVISSSVSALYELQVLSYAEFVSDHRLVSSAERDLQVAVQAALDIASIILADVAVGVPRAYRDVFPRLGEVGNLAYSIR